MSKQITLEQVRAAAAELDPDEKNGAICVYVEVDERGVVTPSCFVGQIATRLVGLDLARELEWSGGAPLVGDVLTEVRPLWPGLSNAGDMLLDEGFTLESVCWLGAAQHKCDGHEQMAWGPAAAYADEHYKEIVESVNNTKEGL